jgi:hypothetical protein
MATLTSSATLTIADAAVAVESIAVNVLPVAATSTGRGRLIHPSLGTYDYIRGPDEWQNIDGSPVIAPIWGSQKTLLGASNTLFSGDLRDVIVEERWTQSVAGEIAHFRMLLAMWTNPPDPAVAYVQWYPTYTSTQGFNVVMLGLTLGGREITITSLSHQGWVRGPLVLRMRITGQIADV